MAMTTFFILQYSNSPITNPPGITTAYISKLGDYQLHKVWSYW